ncbi:MAG: ABC transporter permease [Planctomycetes bacterium]|nr:ABC transporter permease [Planctomycetota bacterium]
MRYGLLLRRNLFRRRLRSLLTLGGLACAVALFATVESLNDGLEKALGGDQARRTLVVYRKNRYCPQTSHLPEYYAREISRLDGVSSVLPVKLFLNNCRTSLDMITFQGTPVETMLKQRRIELVSGDLARFEREPDAALVGRGFAARRGITVGENFRFSNVNVKVVGIFRAAESTEEEIILTHLEYLQRAGPVNRLGTVTQFDVLVDDPDRAGAVATAIDELFADSEEPTDTRPKIAFLESATRDLREILRFGRIFGLSCALVALALMGGTVVMGVQERYREFGAFRTIGYKARHIAGLVLGEAFLLAVLGAATGLGLATLLVAFGGIAVGVEGVQVAFSLTPMLFGKGLAMALICAGLAAAVPAWRAARIDVVQALRTI